MLFVIKHVLILQFRKTKRKPFYVQVKSGWAVPARRRCSVLVSPQLAAVCWFFLPVDDTVDCLRLWVWKQVLSFVLMCQTKFRVPSLHGVTREMLEGAQSEDSVVLLEDLNTDVGNDSEACWGVIRRNGLLDLNLRWCSGIGLRCKTQLVYNKHHVQT